MARINNLNSVILTNPDDNFNPYNAASPLPVTMSGGGGGDATAANQTTMISSLSDINKKSPSLKGFAQILLINHAPIWADSVPAPIIDSNHRDGWYYTNTSAGDKANIYFFAGAQENLLVSELTSVWAKVSIDNNSSANSLPHFVVYTKPTGSGDAGAWYHSRFTYTLNSNANIGLGEEVIIHTNDAPDIDYDCRFLPLPNVTVDGDGLGTEEILYMTIHTQSGATAGDVKILFQNLGFVASDITRNLHLIGFEGSEYPTNASGVLLTARDPEYPTNASGVLLTARDPEYPTNASGVLRTAQDFNITQVAQTITLANVAYGYSESVHNTSPSDGYMSIWGNSDTQNNKIQVQYSHDNITWYWSGNNVIEWAGISVGNFGIDFKTNANYIRVGQYNNSGSSKTLTLNMVLT